jgi:hypothetical protein
MFEAYGKAKPKIEHISGLNLAVAKLMTIQVTKLPLYHKISKIDMICFPKPILKEDLYIVQKAKFSITIF